MVAEPIPEPTRMTEAEYLEYEQHAEYKNEYADGEIIAMSGASRTHNVITLNTSANLHAQLREKPCESYQGDMRVKVKARATYRYPDVVIVCGEPEFADTNPPSLLNPTVLIEVLSPSTASIDRLQKLDEYRQIESLQEYLIISQEMARIDHYVRQDASSWLYTDVRDLSVSVHLPSIDCTLALNDVYQRVTFDSE